MATSDPALTATTDPLVDAEFDKLWNRAIERYEKETTIVLASSDIANKIRNKSPSEVSAVVEGYAEEFGTFREHGGRTKEMLSRTVEILLLFAGPAGNTLSAAVPGGSFVVVGITALLQAVGKVSELYDAVENVLVQINNEFGRIAAFHQRSSVSAELSKAFISSLVVMIDLLRIVTSYCHKFVKGKNNSWKRRAKDFVEILTGDSTLQDKVRELETWRDAQMHLAVAETHANVREVQGSIAEITARMDTIKASNEFENIRDRFPFGNASLHAELLLAKHEDTCEWIMTETSFKEWRGGKNSVYSILAPAGNGKTTACAHIIEQLQEELRNQDPKAPPVFTLAYYIFRATVNRDNTCLALMNSLVHQLALASPEGWELLMVELSRPGAGGPWTHRRLFIMLQHMLAAAGPTIIIIDALDECFSNDPRSSHAQEDMLKFLRDMHELNFPTLRLLVTSRPEPRILAHLNNIHPALLSLKDLPKHREDMAKYVSDKLDGPTFTHWPKAMRVIAKEALSDMKKSQGMFLWVSLQVRHLEECPPQNIFDALEHLPTGLDETYRGILMRFRPQRSSLSRVRLILSFIAFARRPPTVVEVIAALSFDIVTMKIKHFEVRITEAVLVRMLPGLIEIVDHGEGRIVQFIHFSVKEYLTSEELFRDEKVREYFLDEHLADISIAMLSLAALMPENKDALGSLQKYAVRYWHEHVHPDVGNGEPDTSDNSDTKEHREAAERLNSALEVFLCPDSNSAAFELWRLSVDTQASMPTSLHCAVHYALHGQVKRLVEQGADCNTLVHGRSLLHYAVSRRPAKACILEALLKGAADPNLTAGDGFTPLHQAVSLGDEDTVCTLLRGGADIWARTIVCRYGRRFNTEGEGEDGAPYWLGLGLTGGIPIGATALHIAVLQERVSICGILLAHTTGLGDLPDWAGQTPLHYAAQLGHPEILEILMDHQASGRATDITGQTPLSLARQFRGERCVRLLEEYDKNTQSLGAPELASQCSDTDAPPITSSLIMHISLEPNDSFYRKSLSSDEEDSDYWPTYSSSCAQGALPSKAYSIRIGWSRGLQTAHSVLILELDEKADSFTAKLVGVNTDGSHCVISTSEVGPGSLWRVMSQWGCGAAAVHALRAEDVPAYAKEGAPAGLLVHLAPAGKMSTHPPMSFPLPLSLADRYWVDIEDHDKFLLRSLASAAMHFRSCNQRDVENLKLDASKSDEHIDTAVSTSSSAAEVAEVERDTPTPSHPSLDETEVSQTSPPPSSPVIDERASVEPNKGAVAPRPALSTSILLLCGIAVTAAVVYVGVVHNRH